MPDVERGSERVEESLPAAASAPSPRDHARQVFETVLQVLFGSSQLSPQDGLINLLGKVIELCGERGGHFTKCRIELHAILNESV